ncbi:MAG: hypothetical protein U5J97_09855 [Trueperaceae bacterium]|nr:hypothetical protein [Trueperaceae bacterium]
MTQGAHVREVTADTPPLPLHDALDVFRPPAQQHAALIDIASDPHGLVVVAEDEAHTVGYLTFHPPSEIETWGDDRSGRLIELGAIEVAPDVRGERLAERMLVTAFDGGRFDGTVVFATLYAWHYDVDRSGLGSFAYRRRLEHLYGKVGLESMPTSDPEVRADPANALVARIGPHAPDAVVREFNRLRTQPHRLGL